jgi:hypothetical protein
MWCFVCGGEYRQDLDRCPECGVDLIVEEPTKPLLPMRSWLPVGPDYVDREYRIGGESVFDAAEYVLVNQGWRVDALDRERLAVAASTGALPVAWSRQEIAVFVVPSPSPGCHLRCAMQYSGAARQKLSTNNYTAVPELTAFLDAVDAQVARA